MAAYWGLAGQRDLTRDQITGLGGAEYKAFFEQTLADKGRSGLREFLIPVNFLTTLLIKAQASDDGHDMRYFQTFRELRAENLVLLAGLCIGMMLALSATKPALILTSTALPTIATSGGVGSREAATPLLPATLSAIQLFGEEVGVARLRAADLYKRSTLLLAGGIAMAFVGVFVFYLSLPVNDARESNLIRQAEFLQMQVNQLERSLAKASGSMLSAEEAARLFGQLDSSEVALRTIHNKSASEAWIEFASRSMRPFGMLIFLEGIAWFLLRQYRALLQDYKAFLRVYLKRSNYLIAMTALSEPIDEKRAGLIAGLIAEDVKGAYYSPGDVPRSQRLTDGGPVLEAITELANSIPRIARG
jgi:hypothetical protein